MKMSKIILETTIGKNPEQKPVAKSTVNQYILT